jgi:ribonuclease-3
MLNNNLSELQNLLGYEFNNTDILTMALTHKSFAIENNTAKYYERLEFLGDSIISAITCSFLYEKFPDLSEGELSKIKSQIVSAENMSVWACLIKLGSFILLGKNEKGIKDIRMSKNLLCDCFEAVIGAVFMDGGFENAKRIISAFIERNEIYSNDYKSALQEIAQRNYGVVPSYQVSKTFGPDHNKNFEVTVSVKSVPLGIGVGKTKKEAQQRAAEKAIKNISVGQ